MTSPSAVAHAGPSRKRSRRNSFPSSMAANRLTAHGCTRFPPGPLKSASRGDGRASLTDGYAQGHPECALPYSSDDRYFTGVAVARTLSDSGGAGLSQAGEPAADRVVQRTRSPEQTPDVDGRRTGTRAGDRLRRQPRAGGGVSCRPHWSERRDLDATDHASGKSVGYAKVRR